MLMFGDEYNIVRHFPDYFLDYREVLDPSIVGLIVYNQVQVNGLEIYVTFILESIIKSLKMLKFLFR